MLKNNESDRLVLDNGLYLKMGNGASSVSMIVFRKHCYRANCTTPKIFKWSIKRPPRPSLIITVWLHLRNRSGLIIDAASNEQEHSLITQDVSVYSNGFHQRVIRTVFPEKVRQTKFIHSLMQALFYWVNVSPLVIFLVLFLLEWTTWRWQC